MITFISASRSIQHISRSVDVRTITPLPVKTMYLEFSDSNMAVPTPENRSLRLADVVPIGSPD